jgi:hypothetical protein
VSGQRNLLPDSIVPGAPGEGVELWIYSVVAKPDWRARVKGTLTRAEHPGSAIKYHDKIYELVSAEETVQGGFNHRYGLRAWDSAFAIRTLAAYTPQAEAAVQARQREEVQKADFRLRVLWLFPFAGLAPASIQDRWELETGLSMAWVSAGSAFFFLLVALALRELTEGTRAYPLAIYLAGESFFRLLASATFHRPCGALWVVLPYRLWHALTSTPPQAAGRPAVLAAAMEDQVIRRPGENSIQVRSPFYDSDLRGDAPVRMEGEFYRPRHCHREGKGLRRRWVYELEMIHTAPTGPTREFITPRPPARHQAVEKFTHQYDLAHSFALFWGFYPRRDQLRLNLAYEYDGIRNTQITAGIFLIAAILEAAITFAYRAPIFMQVGPVYLLGESAYRLYRVKAFREPAGSIVGYVVGLIIHPPR